MNYRLERMILRELCLNPAYRQKALSYLKHEYFNAVEEQLVLQVIKDYTQKYNSSTINFDVLGVELAQSRINDEEGFNEQRFKRAKELLDSIINTESTTDTQWMLDQTEKFCQERAMGNALFQAMQLWEKNKAMGSTALGAIPDILHDALKITFEESLGHDYWSDAELAFDNYVNHEGERFSFGLKILDLITNGGILRKTLNIGMAGTGGGKTIFLCQQAANHTMQGRNVLYLTGEMAETKIRERIDANLLDVEVNNLRHMSKTVFMAKQKKLKAKTTGRLIIKEFEEGGATTALDFSRWIEELKVKQNFVPDVVIIDYLTLLGSSRVKLSQGSYVLGKAVAEEVRALAKRYNVAILTAAQFNRGGMDNSDPGLGNTSESVGIPFTADLIFAIIKTGDLVKLGQVMFKQLKNRYNDENYFNKFIMGLDKPKMRFYDVEESAQMKADEINVEDDETGSSFEKLNKAARRRPGMFD